MRWGRPALGVALAGAVGTPGCSGGSGNQPVATIGGIDLQSMARPLPYTSAAAELDRRHAYSAVFTRAVRTNATLAHFDLRAAGAGRSAVTVVLVDPDTATARTNADRLKTALDQGKTDNAFSPGD